MLDLFPFHLVEKGSTILLYGLGQCGRTYIEQNQQLRWCEIKYVSDRKQPADVSPFLYVKPEDISDVMADVDKIVIGISKLHYVWQVKEYLAEQGVSEDRIVIAWNKDDMILENSSQKRLRILLGMGGGLGDCIVFLSFYQRLVEYVPDAEIIIQGRANLLDVVYGQKPNTTIISEDLIIENQNEFDCVLMLDHFISVIWYNPMVLPKELVKKFECYRAEYEEKYNMGEMRYARFIRRMLIAGKNRYDALGGGSIFNLRKEKLNIDFTEQARKTYEEYNLTQYITFNYGSDRRRNATKEQLKVWPKELYKEWVDKFKAKYPNLEIIQIGTKDATIIEGAHRYILGEDFEVVKYILKNAIFHLDCEGGLVHLATAIGTRCIVLFGPTPLKYYAYPQNVNLCTGVCVGCMDLSDNWYYECVNNNKQCCMYSITPEMVMEKISFLFREWS